MCMNTPEQQNSQSNANEFYLEDPFVSTGSDSRVRNIPSSGRQTDLSFLSANWQEHKNFFSLIGLSVLTLTLVYQTFAALAATVISLFAPWITETWWYSWVLTDVSLYGVGLPVSWLILRTIPTAPHTATYCTHGTTSEKPAFGFGWWAVIAVVGLGVMQIGGLIGQWTMNWLSAAVGFDYASSLDTLVNESPLWASFVGTVLLAPLGEEFMFRKLLIDRTRRYGDTVSILLSGILFGLFHGNLFQFFYAAMLGMLLAYLYTRTGKLGWCIGLHALANFCGGIIPTLLQNWIGRDILDDPEKLTAHFIQNPGQYLVYMLYAMSVYAFMIAAVVLVICLQKKIKLGHGLFSLPPHRRFSTVVLNVGMILAFAVSLAIILSGLILPPLSAHLQGLMS